MSQYVWQQGDRNCTTQSCVRLLYNFYLQVLVMKPKSVSLLMIKSCTSLTIYCLFYSCCHQCEFLCTLKLMFHFQFSFLVSRYVLRLWPFWIEVIKVVGWLGWFTMVAAVTQVGELLAAKAVMGLAADPLYLVSLVLQTTVFYGFRNLY